MPNYKSIADFKTDLSSNVDLQNQFKQDPVQAAKNVSITPIIPDTWIYRIVVGALGLAVILVIIAVVILSINSKDSDKAIPTILTAIASGAIGALARSLAPSPNSSSTNNG